MSTIDWPDALVPQTCQLALRKSGQQFASPFNGTTQALDFIAERWVLSVSLAQMAARNPRGVGSFCNRLAGGVERVRGWNFGHNRGLPMGTLRGAPVLASSAARGDVVLSISGATSRPNLFVGGGFEVDSNADGVANGWAAYSSGAVAGVAHGLTTAVTAGFGAKHQLVSATSLGVSTSDRIGVGQTSIGVIGGASYVVSAAMSWTAASTASYALYIDWRDGGGGYLSSSTTFGAPLSGSLTRYQFSAAAPIGAASADVYIFAHSRAAGAGVAALLIDAAQFEPGSVATAYAGPPSLLADDMLGAGGQLFQVAADTLLDDAGAGTVPVVNRVRATIASSTAVLWSRPTAEFILPAMQAGPVYRPGAIESAALDLVEVWG